MLRIGFYQFYPAFARVHDNLEHVIRALEHADADLIVLPELAFTGYSFRDRVELAYLAEEPHTSSTVDSLVALCRARDFYLVTGFAEKCADKYFNSALLIGPHGLVHTYRKLHLFGTELDYFDRGDIPLQVHQVRGVGVGMMICFDWIFPEVTRILALKGADVICHPANLVLTYCQQTMLARCIENMVFAVTANRYGIEKRPHSELVFTGQSQIVAPKGTPVYQSRPDQDDLYVAQIDPALARTKTITPQNDVLADRRPEFYSELSI
ncbi:MAG: acyltransferase [Anaerolineae bacterium]|nr:acyltransferase [Anaerolineae bacterium]